MTADLEARIRRIEDRIAIVDVVVSYARSIDEADWETYGTLFTDPVHIDFSEAGLPAADLPRDQFVAFAKQGLEGWTARQHISPNHQVVFDPSDPDRAVCHSYMYAQHYAKGSPAGELYLMRGSYDNELVRTAEGWRIERLTQHISWIEGDPSALETATA